MNTSGLKGTATKQRKRDDRKARAIELDASGMDVKRDDFTHKRGGLLRIRLFF